jgi:hypothetical protein
MSQILESQFSDEDFQFIDKYLREREEAYMILLVFFLGVPHKACA